LTGFEDREIDRYLCAPGLEDERADALPDLSAQAVTRSGDVWSVGSIGCCAGIEALPLNAEIRA
jgi:hypothetical protein